MPAYNAEKTLQKTYDEIPKDIVDVIILTDDASKDKTVHVAERLGIKTFVHTENKGYGGNQKTCYQEALNHGADIVIMLHPDYQYTPKLITPMASMIAEGIFDSVIGSRILGNKAMMGGMPFYKYTPPLPFSPFLISLLFVLDFISFFFFLLFFFFPPFERQLFRLPSFVD